MSRRRPRPFLTGLAIGVGLTLLPVAASAQQEFCNPASIGAVLDKVARRASENPALQLLPGDAELLRRTIALAHEQMAGRLASAEVLSRVRSESRDALLRPTQPLLSGSERSELESWSFICGEWSPDGPDPLKSGGWTYVQPGQFDEPRDGATSSASPATLARGTRLAGETHQAHIRTARDDSPSRGRPQASSMPQPRSGLTKADLTTSILTALGLATAAAAFAVDASNTEKRRAKRYSCHAPSWCRMGEMHDGPAIVVDISRLGCKLRVDGPLPARAKCRVWLGGGWIDARVAWSNRHYAGLAFSKAVRNSLVTSLARAGAVGAGARSRMPTHQPG